MDSALDDWVRSGVRLSGYDPPAGPDLELPASAACWAGVRVVGLGEATHGSSEFFRVKHRLVRYLVQQQGFRVLALEASAYACRIVDRYVSGQDGSEGPDEEVAGQVLRDLGYWTLATSEVRDLLVWLRRHNAGRPAAEQVRVVGLDPVVEEAAIDPVCASVQGSGGAALAERCRSALSQLAQGHRGEARASHLLAAARQRPMGQEDLAEIRQVLLDSRSMVESDPGAVAVLTIGLRAAEVLGAPPLSVRSGTARDRAMAAAVTDLSGPADGPKVMVWAHNGHVAADRSGDGRDTLGAELRRVHGSGYRAVGLLFGSGCFRALAASTPAAGPQEYCCPPAKPRTLEHQLLQAGADGVLLDVRAANQAESPVRHWLRRSQQARSIGSMVFWWRLLRQATSPVRPAAAYDSLLVVAHSTSAELL